MLASVLVGLALGGLVIAARVLGSRRARSAAPVDGAGYDVATPVRLADPSGRRGRGGDGIVR